MLRFSENLLGCKSSISRYMRCWYETNSGAILELQVLKQVINRPAVLGAVFDYWSTKVCSLSLFC
jgi:hypothetical protein